MDGLMTIELKNLKFYAAHGFYEEERKVGNEFEVNVSIGFVAPAKTITSINETLNYVDAYKIVEEEFLEPKNLLETVAMSICDKLYKQFLYIKSVSISIIKISPPITNFRGSVGVSYSKNFE